MTRALKQEPRSLNYSNRHTTPGQIVLLNTVRTPQDDNSIIRPPCPKSKSNFGNLCIILAATDGIVCHENGQENDYGLLARKDFGKHKNHVGNHYVTYYYTGGYDKYASIDSEARYLS